MKETMKHELDPRFDLAIERVVDVPPAAVWRAWTDPEWIVQWFTPAPWKTLSAKVDLRPGGVFSSVMQSPEGVTLPENEGCFLEVVENQKLVWTSSLGPGYRPNPLPDTDAWHFTAVITMEPHGEGTKYRALAIHGTEEARKKHEEMGFHTGWGAALDQLVELAKKS